MSRRYNNNLTLTETAMKKRKPEADDDDINSNNKRNYNNNNIFNKEDFFTNPLYNSDISINNYDNVDDDLTLGSNNSNINNHKYLTTTTPAYNGGNNKTKSIFKSPPLSTGSLSIGSEEQSSSTQQQRKQQNYNNNRRIVKKRSKDDLSIDGASDDNTDTTSTTFQEICSKYHTEYLQQLNQWFYQTLVLNTTKNGNSKISVPVSTIIQHEQQLQQLQRITAGRNDTDNDNDTDTENDNDNKFLYTHTDRPMFTYSHIVSEYLRLSRDYTRRYGCPVPTIVTTGTNGTDSNSTTTTTTTIFATGSRTSTSGYYGGEVVPMGSDDGNQCGLALEYDINGEEKDKPTEVAPFILSSFHHCNPRTFKAVSAGGLHSVALNVDGNVYTWGGSDDGALGRESLAERITITTTSTDSTTGSTNSSPAGTRKKTLPPDHIALESEPGLVLGFTTIDGINEDGQIIQVAAGDSHTLFVSLSGNVYQCGAYKDCDSGYFHDCDTDNNVVGFNRRPVHVAALYGKPVREVFTRSGFNAALLMDDTIVTWGFGCKGELARSGNMAGTSGPDKDGMYILDKQYFYNLSTGKPNINLVKEQFLTPKPPIWADTVLRPKKQVIAVATGAYHLLVCARDPYDSIDSFTSRLYTSGLNNYGQLGHGDVYIDRHQLTIVTALEHANITYVAAGEHHSLALNIHGTELYSFGRGDYGQLGIGKINQAGFCQTTPILVPFPPKPTTTTENSIDNNSTNANTTTTTTGSNHIPIQQRIIKIAAGDRHSMALTVDNTVYTWGFNETNVTGHTTIGDGDDVVVPTLLNIEQSLKTKKLPLSKVYDISGGGQHSLLLVKRYTG